MFHLHDDSLAPRRESPAQKAAETRRRRRRERETRAWKGRLGLLVDMPSDSDPTWLIADEIEGGNVAATVERAIAGIREALEPLTQEQVLEAVEVGVEDPRPLEQDVMITHGGKVLAVVQASSEGAIVTRFTTKGPVGSPDAGRWN